MWQDWYFHSSTVFRLLKDSRREWSHFLSIDSQKHQSVKPINAHPPFGFTAMGRTRLPSKEPFPLHTISNSTSSNTAGRWALGWGLEFLQSDCLGGKEGPTSYEVLHDSKKGAQKFDFQDSLGGGGQEKLKLKLEWLALMHDLWRPSSHWSATSSLGKT